MTYLRNAATESLQINRLQIYGHSNFQDDRIVQKSNLGSLKIDIFAQSVDFFQHLGALTFSLLQRPLQASPLAPTFH